MLNAHPELKKDLFIRGFLITSCKLNNLDNFPFFGNWNSFSYGKYNFYWHNLTNFYCYEEDNVMHFLFGHAYNPFTMSYDELSILKELSVCNEQGHYIDKINELTGVFVIGKIHQDNILFINDASGLQSAFSGIINNHFYLSSHAQLVGDVCDLTMDPFVEKLINYRWYQRILGPYLPADLSPFCELKRVLSGFTYKSDLLSIHHKRFWPVKLQECKDYKNTIQESSQILKNNIQLVVKKWKYPAISLTGGIDSNTTFAAANGLYDKIWTFSYISADKEEPDAKAAEFISDAFNCTHRQYNIPYKNSEIDLFDERKQLFLHNNGYVAKLYDYELRKKLYLKDFCNCTVEVKSWVSETIRCYWYKYYNRKKFPKLSAKLFRNFYKIFILNRFLAKKIDKIYEKYMKEYEYEFIDQSILPADLNYHDIGWGSWGSQNITEMKYCFDITSIYNNRIFLEKMLMLPFDKRLNDKHHKDLKKTLNTELFDLNIQIKNVKETKFRAFMLNILFTINSVLPF